MITFATGVLLELSGFVPNVPEQPSATKWVIYSFFIFLPLEYTADGNGGFNAYMSPVLPMGPALPTSLHYF